MARPACGREADILEAVTFGRWGTAPEPELTAHLSSCPSCSDLAAVASALVAERDAAIRDVALPGSGLAWWRVQLRARRERESAAARAAALAHAAVVAGALALAVVAFAASWILVAPSGVRLEDLLARALPGLAKARVVVTWGAPLLLALVAWLALAPVAAWLALTED